MAASEIKLVVEMCPKGFRFRANWRGKLILQRSYENKLHADHNGNGFGRFETLWRDATATDLQDFFTIKETP